jgi:hypothetical protein
VPKTTADKIVTTTDVSSGIVVACAEHAHCQQDMSELNGPLGPVPVAQTAKRLSSLVKRDAPSRLQ